MWIVDDDGDMFNTDRFCSITFYYDANRDKKVIKLWENQELYFIFALSIDLTDEERLDRYHDLVEKLTGRIYGH